MSNKATVAVQMVIKDGPLAGTIIEQTFAFLMVRYPHRKRPDLYIAMKPKEGEAPSVHCVQECAAPDFSPSELSAHLERHAGKLIRKTAREGR